MTPNKLALVGLAGAILCILSPVAIALPFSPVPISLGLFGIFLSTCLFGAKLTFAGCLVYLLIGFVGLPVFSGFAGGAGILLGPTGGYLLGYLCIPLLTGLFTLHRKKKNSRPLLLAGMLTGLFLCYLLGTLWLSHSLNLDLPTSLLIGVLPYLPADLLKLTLAWMLGTAVRRRLYKAGFILW